MSRLYLSSGSFGGEGTIIIENAAPGDLFSYHLNGRTEILGQERIRSAPPPGPSPLSHRP